LGIGNYLGQPRRFGRRADTTSALGQLEQLG